MSATPTPPVIGLLAPSPATPTPTLLTPTLTASAPTDNPAVATTVTRTPTPSATPSATPTVTPTLATPVLARNQTVILAGTLDTEVGVSNPWASGYTHQAGNAFLWEPLAYYGIFAQKEAQKEIPWLAESMTYDEGWSRLTIKLNPLAEWSDGQPVIAKDVAFTFNGEFTDDRLPYHAEFTQFVQDWSTPDNQTVILDFKRPAPRFKYEVLTFKFDSGLPIVPEHVLASQLNVTTYAGGLDMPHSGPYKLVSWDENQKTFALREDWWAIKAGLSADPAVKAVQILRVLGPRVPSLESLISLLAKNQIDASLDMPARLMASILKEDPNVTSWTGQAAPYGYVAAWPNALWMNDQVAPYSNPNVRKALSLVINRDVLDKLVYGGTSVTTIYPFPLLPAMQPFADSAPVKELEKQYNPRAYNPELSAQLMTEAGYKRVAGLWTDSQGQTVNATLYAIPTLHADLAAALSDMLRAGGFDARVNFGGGAYDNMLAGSAGLYLFGHEGGTRDPFAALNQFNSWFSAPVGSPAYPNYFSRYKNPEYDKLVDALAELSPDDPHASALAAKALGIYWQDTIDIPLVQWVDRIPYNQTYWTNWPSADNAAAGTSGAFWHETGPLVITRLVPAGSVSN